MKRTRYISLIIALLSVFGITAQQQQSQYALYNYRNDGDFNAWLNIDVDSITYSNIGLDSIEYDNFVTQEVWTPDSCYRIPLEVIDSIGFRAPKPIMQEGLFYLRDYHASLTNSIDSLTIYFDKSILPDSLPSIGQVVLNATYTSPYEGGFAGRVKSIESNDTSVVMECEMIAIGDVYKRLVLVGKAITDSEGGASSRRRAAGDAWIDFEDKDIKVIDNIGDFTFSCLNGILSVISKDPTAVVSYYVYIDEFFYSMYAQLNLIHHDLQTHVNISLAKIESLNKETKDIFKALTSVDNLDSWLEGKLNGAEDKKDEPGEIDLLNYLWKNHKLKNKVPIPIAGPLVLDYEFAPMLKLKGDLELDWAFKTTALNTFYVKASGYTAAVATNPQLSLLTGLAKVEGNASFSSDPISNQQIDFRVKGSLTTGISGKVTISLINKNVVHATVSAQGGLKTSGQLNLKLMDTSTDDAVETISEAIYEATKDTKFKTELFAKAGVNFGATPAKLLSIGEEWEFYTKDLGTTYLFPHFSQPALPTYNREKDQWSNGNSNNHVVLESSPSKNIPDFLLGPCKIGLKIIDENGVCVKESDEREYRDDGTIIWSIFPLSIDLTGLTPGKTYRCFPVLRYHKRWQLRATPSYEFTVPEPMTLVLDTPLNAVTLKKGQEGFYAINGGWGDYSANTSMRAICSADIEMINNIPYVKLAASKLMTGPATITVKDLRAGTTETILVTVAGELIPVTGITLSQTTLSLQEGDTQSLTATVLPEDADNRNVVWESSNDGVATVSVEGLVTAVSKGNCTIYCSAIDGSGVKAECQVKVKTDNSGTLNGRDYVDLGLPSGTLWATCNVGANSPEESGHYFAWGETEPKSEYNWSTYFDTEDGGRTFKKYYNDGGSTELLPEDDAATANWGSEWQMPSYAQFDELINSKYTTATWTEQNGVNGRLITSNSNGKSIFLPITGNNCGFYWSHSCGTRQSYCASLLYFSSGQIMTADDGRCYGFCVRPVRVWETQYEWPVTEIVLNETSMTLQPTKAWNLVATIKPDYAINKNVLWSSSNNNVATVDQSGKVTAVSIGTCTIICSAVDGSGVKAECVVTVMESDANSHGTTDGHEWVDLGLPSGTLWAICNIGANSPEEFGDYFAWGETQPKEEYSMNNWQEVLAADFGPEHDAATANWGSSWQMPSSVQFEELLNSTHTIYGYTTQSGVNGLLFTSRINGESIFLPAAGHILRKDLISPNTCCYWSSSFWSLLNSTWMSQWTGYVGLTVRPVRVQ